MYAYQYVIELIGAYIIGTILGSLGLGTITPTGINWIHFLIACVCTLVWVYVWRSYCKSNTRNREDHDD